MKQLMLLPTCLLLHYSIIQAQNNNDKIPVDPIEPSLFSLGIKGGLGHSFMVPYGNYDLNTSGELGISAIYAPANHWGIGAGVNYSREGLTFENSDLTSSTQLDYIRVPIQAIYFFRNYENDFRPKIGLGPSFGFLVNEYNSFTSRSLDPQYFDLGASASVGFNYRLLRAVWLNMDVNYYQGLLDVYTYNPETDLNGNVRLNLGLSLGF